MAYTALDAVTAGTTAARGSWAERCRTNFDDHETRILAAEADIAALEAGTTGIVRVAEVAITNSQIKALRATPKTLVAAPGSGYVLEFVGAVLIHDYGTNVLTETSDNLGVRYTNGSGAQVSTDIEATGFVDAAADKIINVIPQKDVILVANAALVLHNIGGDEFAGNAANDTVWRAKVAYRVWATGL